MISLDRSRNADENMLAVEQDSVFSDEMDPQLGRIRRIGKRLFAVANCIITFQTAASPQPGQATRSMASIETAFCQRIPLFNEMIVVPNTRLERALYQDTAVVGAPYIRFYAAHPILNGDGTSIGSVNLIDYLPRTFSKEDRQMLIDLAALVKRELDLRSMSASQLDLQKKNKNLHRESLIDPLLGIWNRGAIMRILTIEALRCDKIGVPLSLIVIDIDHFKKINDTYGHPAGDTVLVKVAGRLRSCIRAQEALGRYGGEEFLAVLPGASHLTAMSVAERMRVAIASEPEVIGDAAFSMTISAGIASTDMFPTATTEELISHADVALYAAKDGGRNRVMQANPDLK